MTTSSPVASGTFLLCFPTEPTALAAAREARARGFVVNVPSLTEDQWQTTARARAVVPTAELHRYAGRLRRIAHAFDGTYVGFTAD